MNKQFYPLLILFAVAHRDIQAMIFLLNLAGFSSALKRFLPEHVDKHTAFA
jgi:hypothetical protein